MQAAAHDAATNEITPRPSFKRGIYSNLELAEHTPGPTPTRNKKGLKQRIDRWGSYQKGLEEEEGGIFGVHEPLSKKGADEKSVQAL